MEDNTVVGRIRNGFLGRMMRYRPYTVVVWLALARRADQSGRCWPSITTIQKDTGLGRPTVYRAIRELVDAGEIVVEPGGGKGNQTNRYRFASSSHGELVTDGNQFPTLTKVVPHRDKGSSQGEHKPYTRTKHKNQTNGRARSLSADTAFSTWWASYPRKVAKQAARKAWEKAVKEITSAGGTLDEARGRLQRAVDQFAKSDKARGDFCPYPATWLNQGRYDDDPAAWQDTTSNGKAKAAEPLKYRN